MPRRRTPAADARVPGWLRRLAPDVLRSKSRLVLTFGAALTGMIAQAVAPLVMRTIVDDAILADSPAPYARA